GWAARGNPACVHEQAVIEKWVECADREERRRHAGEVGVERRYVGVATQFRRDLMTDEPFHSGGAEPRIPVAPLNATRARRYLENAVWGVGCEQRRVVVTVAQPQKRDRGEIPAGRCAADDESLGAELRRSVLNQPERSRLAVIWPGGVGVFRRQPVIDTH